MNGSLRPPADDPLYGLPDAARPHYATGMLLDAEDFAAEQIYHRNRLARALAFASGAGARRLPEDAGESPGATGLLGGGTLAGLRVTVRPAAGTQPEEIRVAPGLAVDRLGRLVEVPRPVCLRLQRWFDGELERDGGDDLRRAAQTDLARFASTRLSDDIAGGAEPLPARAVIVDVFVRFVTCRQALTPAFASGPFDALDAVETTRLRDAYEVHFVPRTDGLDDDFSGLPLLDRDLSALSGAGLMAAGRLGLAGQPGGKQLITLLNGVRVGANGATMTVDFHMESADLIKVINSLSELDKSIHINHDPDEDEVEVKVKVESE